MRRTATRSALAAVTLLTTACHLGTPNTATLGTAPVPGTRVVGNVAGAPLGRDTLSVRLLAEGTFRLPAALVSVGSGSLVSVGSGGLVSVGSGGLVSVGSGHYRVQALGDRPVTDAAVSLVAMNGTATGSGVHTDAAGRFYLTGNSPFGLYRVVAEQGTAHYQALAVVGDSAAQAPVSVASTLVTARLMAAQSASELHVLPVSAYADTVAAVADALTDADLPSGWTPEQANATLSALEGAHPQVKAAVADLHDREVRLEQRADAYQYRVEALASELGVPAPRVAAAVNAALSAHPTASDDDIARDVRTQTQAGGGTGTQPAAPTSSASAAAQPTPQASGGSLAPEAWGSTQPTPSSKPSPEAFGSTAPAPTASASPTAKPTAEPSATPRPTPTPTAEPTAKPTPLPTASAPPSTGKDNSTYNASGTGTATPIGEPSTSGNSGQGTSQSTSQGTQQTGSANTTGSTAGSGDTGGGQSGTAGKSDTAAKPDTTGKPDGAGTNADTATGNGKADGPGGNSNSANGKTDGASGKSDTSRGKSDGASGKSDKDPSDHTNNGFHKGEANN